MPPITQTGNTTGVKDIRSKLPTETRDQNPGADMPIDRSRSASRWRCQPPTVQTRDVHAQQDWLVALAPSAASARVTTMDWTEEGGPIGAARVHACECISWRKLTNSIRSAGVVVTGECALAAPAAGDLVGKKTAKPIP
jgi:hypothetical protein